MLSRNKFGMTVCHAELVSASKLILPRDIQKIQCITHTFNLFISDIHFSKIGIIP